VISGSIFSTPRHQADGHGPLIEARVQVEYHVNGQNVADRIKRVAFLCMRPVSFNRFGRFGPPILRHLGISTTGDMTFTGGPLHPFQRSSAGF
jgi:hypothetical protein